MKIIRIIFFTLLALSLIAGTAIFIFFQTFDTDQYLPQITDKASLALGRQVSIGGVGLGLSSRGITLDAGPVTIADDTAFTSQLFIKIDRVRISLDLKSLILRREIHITGILLQSPQIHIIRSQEGAMNIRSIGQENRSTANATAGAPSSVIASEAKPRHGGDSSSEKAPRDDAIIIKSIKIQDASISFIDQSQAYPLDIWLTDINASALMSLDLSKRSVQIDNLILNLDLTRLDIDSLKDISPQMPEISVLKNISGVVQINMAHAAMGASGGLSANGGINITGGVIKNFNIIKMLLSHTLGAFGGMGDKIDDLLNGQLKDSLGAKDTVIEKAQAQFSLHDKTVFIDGSLIQTNIFELTAKGSVDQGSNVDMQTMLHLNSDVSAALVNELGGLRYLMGDDKRIAIGASLQGVIPHLKYKPNKDFRKKSKRFLIEEGGNILGVLLGGR